MAVYSGSSLIRSIVGKLGGQIFYRWRNLTCVKQAEVSVSDPHSAQQTIIRNAIGGASTAWYGTLTAAQRQQWEVYAKTMPVDIPIPHGIRQLIPIYTRPQSGINAYQMVNALLASSGQSAVSVPPLVSGSRDPVPALTFSYGASKSLGEGEIPLAINYFWVYWTNPAGQGAPFLRVWIDSVQELFHKQIIWNFATAKSPPLSLEYLECRTIKGANGTPAPVADFAGSDMLIQADLIYDDGYRTGASQTYEFNIA